VESGGWPRPPSCSAARSGGEGAGCRRSEAEAGIAEEEAAAAAGGLEDLGGRIRDVRRWEEESVSAEQEPRALLFFLFSFFLFSFGDLDYSDSNGRMGSP